MTREYSGESGRKADASRIIRDIHSELEKHGVHYDGESPPKNLDWRDEDDRAMVRRKFDDPSAEEAILPGFGERGHGNNARDDCGESHPFICESCGHRVDFGRTCGQSVCQRCGVAWVRDAAIQKSAKVRRIRKEEDWHTHDGEHQKIHHMVINPSLGWYYNLARDGLSMKEAHKKTQAMVKNILDEMRAQGLLLRHSFRGKRRDGSLADEKDDRGAWKERLNSDRDWWGDVRNQLAWMPHFHCVVVGDFMKGDGFSDKIENKTGWVIRRIANEDNVSIPNDGAMARVVTYSLSHADIDVRENANRSAVWEVGSFQGDIVKSSSRFTPREHDLQWADNVVRRIAPTTLGIRSGTTECGASIPAVDDPDEMARSVIAELYDHPDAPDIDPEDVPVDLVLHHINEGNIDVSVSSYDGGGGSVEIGGSGWDDSFLSGPSAGPYVSSGVSTVSDGGKKPIEPIVDVDDQEDSSDDLSDCGSSCDHDHDRDDDQECDGQLIPLGEARHRGFLEDYDWISQAAHAEQALKADEEYPEDLDPWRTSSPGSSIGAG